MSGVLPFDEANLHSTKGKASSGSWKEATITSLQQLSAQESSVRKGKPTIQKNQSKNEELASHHSVTDMLLRDEGTTTTTTTTTTTPSGCFCCAVVLSL